MGAVFFWNDAVMISVTKVICIGKMTAVFHKMRFSEEIPVEKCADYGLIELVGDETRRESQSIQVMQKKSRWPIMIQSSTLHSIEFYNWRDWSIQPMLN